MKPAAKTRTLKPARRKPAARAVAVKGHAPAFREIIGLIQSARQRAFQAVNTELIGLYWRVGEYICQRIDSDGWGQATIVSLAEFIHRQQPELRGFSAQNLWRMRQFFETYHQEPKLSPLVRVLPWSHNLLILSRCKRREEREFYLRLAADRGWGKRELERQLDGCLFERTVASPPKVSTVLRQLHPAAETIFKDAYLLDFLELPASHSERDLQKALVKNLKQFLIELGPDFCFAGEELRLQVGGQDFYLDLLFYHRSLQCLVAFELKITKFEPEHLGKLAFYLEALDRDVKKPHERPSIGVLLCASKDNEVVKYALNRSMSLALIAEYQTRLPDRKLLERKLHEFYQLAMPKTK
jgi:predicted nuclease of restriction endonuclease-like (RecB) superfamily